MLLNIWRRFILRLTVTIWNKAEFTTVIHNTTNTLVSRPNT